ncbi:MAG TPA: hypothetical protein VKH19_13350 [Gemmatimonadaceae bacterium]|nr:hypothetical protein [Gemmatimonadaceae bacterium]
MRRSSVLAAVIACAPAIAGAQGVRVVPGRPNWSANGATVTATFVIESAASHVVQVAPRVALPANWRLVTGSAPLMVNPGEPALLIVSAMVPVRTVAGSYDIHVALFDPANLAGVDLASDSMRIVVQPRRAVEVALVNHPTFILSGKSYDAEFTVRNRGNVVSSIVLKTRSVMGSAALAHDTLTLEPSESRAIPVHVTRATTSGMAMDDVVELIARMPGDAATPKRASARVTVVPPAATSLDDFQRIPTQLAFRAASTSGVSPFVLTGAGQLREGKSERVEFLMKGRPGPSSLFGDRDEYRVDFRSPTWHVRAGDHLFSMSSLTGGSQEGMGVGADKRLGEWGVGGYAEQFRRSPGNPGEAGAFVSARPADGVRLALNGVSRNNGTLSGQVGSMSASMERGGVSLEAEFAGSANGSGSAALARLLHASGEHRGVSFDAGHSKSDETFLGPQRGAQHDFIAVSTSPTEQVDVNVSASSHASTDALLFGFRTQDRLRLASLGVTLAKLVTIEAAGAQHVRRLGASIDDHQTSLRARATPAFGRFGATVTAELGRAVSDSASVRGFSDVSVNLGTNAANHSISLFAQRYSGGSVLKGIDAMLSLGGTASLRLAGKVDATIIATSSKLETAVPYWVGNVDAQFSHMLRNGATVSLRTRVMQGGFGVASSMPAVAYLEYSMPFGMPIARLRTPGRAIGRVVDASTGRGVANTLVRLGPQVGITDKDGRVSFGGLPAGEHRVSLAQATSYSDAVFIGNPVLHVENMPSAPQHFTLKLANGARIELSARRYAVSRTGIAGSADSLVDVGPLTGAGFRLIGERDTVYRASDENGRVSFTDVAPGRWVIEADGAVPSFHRFDPEKQPVDLTAGETRTVSFRLIPRPREVRIMNQGEEVQAMPAEPRASGASNTPRTQRPQALQPRQQR